MAARQRRKSGKTPRYGKLASLPAIVLVTALLGACGSDNDNPPTDTGTPTAPVDPSPTDPTPTDPTPTDPTPTDPTPTDPTPTDPTPTDPTPTDPTPTDPTPTDPTPTDPTPTDPTPTDPTPTDPTPTDPPPVSGGAASQCVDNLALVAGTRYLLDYRLSGGPQTMEYTSDSQVLGPKVFEGNQTTEVKALVITTSPVSTTTESFNYVGVDGGFSVSYGGTSTMDLAGVGTTDVKTVFVPPQRFAYNLAAGESYSQVYEARTTSTTTVFGVPNTQQTTVNVAQRITFNGIESVTVPAGTFQACKFTIEEGASAGAYDSSSTNWLAVGSGVPVKNQSENGVLELLRGQVNGTAVVGN
jgi:hypothetical protein